MDSVKKSGTMEVSIKVSTKMHRKKAMENTAGQMVTDMLVNGKIICSMEKVFLSGMMIDFSSVSGRTI